jgi:hypothetical protein
MTRRAMLKTAEVPTHAKSVSGTFEVKAGPETAARLGVPEGAVVDVVEAYWHRNRWRRVWWRLTGRKGG